MDLRYGTSSAGACQKNAWVETQKSMKQRSVFFSKKESSSSGSSTQPSTATTTSAQSPTPKTSAQPHPFLPPEPGLHSLRLVHSQRRQSGICISLGDIHNMPTFWGLALFGIFYNFCFHVQTCRHRGGVCLVWFGSRPVPDALAHGQHSPLCRHDWARRIAVVRSQGLPDC